MEEEAASESTEKRPGAILFMCGMNAIRSPMAEALAKSMLPKGTYIASAGVRTGERDPFVDVVLDEVGLSIGAISRRRWTSWRTTISTSS